MAAEEVERHPSDVWPVLTFETEQAFEAWLDAHHADQHGLWVGFGGWDAS
jgi:hypothetical protein